MTMVLLLDRLRAYARTKGLSATAMARAIGVPDSTYRGWFQEGERKAVPSPANVERITRFLETTAGEIARDEPERETLGSEPRPNERLEANARRLRDLLIELERELAVFRDGTRAAREVLRRELDPDDVGYISSLLTMLGDEDKFARWRALTTHRFNRFAHKPKKEPSGDAP